MDNSLKIVSNKLNKLQKETETSITPKQITATPGTPLTPREKKEVKDGLIIGKIKVFGYVVDSDKRPLGNVEINLYGENNDLLKQRKTDKNGYWEVRLPMGKYGVEYIQPGYDPVNKVIKLDKTMNSFEVK
jgi:hypothetical protein